MSTFTDKHKANRVTQLIGHTPVVRLNRVVGENAATVWAKVERHNPGGSVKDRIALAMVEAAEQSGALRPGGTIIEPTSGNTGVGLAMVGAAKGYRVILVMPETMSVERRQLMRAYDAEVILTPGKEGMRGSIAKAKELIAERGGWMPDQFGNPANPEVHRRTTAPEIIAQVPGPIDAFVVGVGTGGTLTGAGAALKAHYPGIQIVALEPAASPVLSGGQAGPHKIAGIGAGFIPDVLDTGLIDRILQVTDAQAFEMARRLAREEGLLVGVSSGAAAWGAVQMAQELGAGKTVVTLLPDTGERYLSTEVFTV
ncbi:MAG: cysteine synthase A [Anaerolineae bacterium]|nr:cysteine synthase A [Anaerolineae bacterium]